MSEEKEQQNAFGDAWAPTRNWLEENGYRTNLSSRSGLYIYPTPFSEIPDHNGIHHILIFPSEKLKLKGKAEIELPAFECTISLDQGFEVLAEKLLAGQGDRLKFLNLQLAVGRQGNLQGRPRVTYEVPLTPLFESGDLQKALYAVTKEIYTNFLLPIISSKDNNAQNERY